MLTYGYISGDEAGEIPEEITGDIPDDLLLMQAMCQMMIQKTDFSSETSPDSFLCHISTEIMNDVSSDALFGPSLT